MEQRGSNSETDRDDRRAYESFAHNGFKGGYNGSTTVLVRQIDDTDAAVIARGQTVDKALGNMEHPGDVTYNPLGGTPLDNTANSNTAAHAVAGVNTPLPTGVEVAPGYSHTGAFTGPGSGRSSLFGQTVRAQGTRIGCKPDSSGEKPSTC